eukprot:scaffold43492_cov23-Tisochrysis_lutea.AAC.8
MFSTSLHHAVRKCRARNAATAAATCISVTRLSWEADSHRRTAHAAMADRPLASHARPSRRAAAAATRRRRARRRPAARAAAAAMRRPLLRRQWPSHRRHRRCRRRCWATAKPRAAASSSTTAAAAALSSDIPRLMHTWRRLASAWAATTASRAIARCHPRIAQCRASCRRAMPTASLSRAAVAARRLAASRSSVSATARAAARAMARDAGTAPVADEDWMARRSGRRAVAGGMLSVHAAGASCNGAGAGASATNGRPSRCPLFAHRTDAAEADARADVHSEAAASRELEGLST